MPSLPKRSRSPPKKPETSPPKKKKKPAPNVLVLVHMNGCGWCKGFEPVWNELLRFKKPPRLHLKLVAFERSDPALARSGYGAYASSYPTLLLHRSDGRVVVFEGERTVERIVAFVGANAA